METLLWIQRVVQWGQCSFVITLSKIMQKTQNHACNVGVNVGGCLACCACAVHKVCTRPYPNCIVVFSTGNDEPCYSFI